MQKLLFLLCSVQIFSTVKSGSHSLWGLSTLILGDSPFPEFITVVMLDDIKVAYYDSNGGNINRQSNSDTECIQEAANIIIGDLYGGMKTRALFSQRQLNLSQGLQIQQELSGCALHNGIPSPLHSRSAFNGVDNAQWKFSPDQTALESSGLWSTMWSNIERNRVELMCAKLYGPLCIKVLKHCLHVRKNDVMRKVKPRVRLLQKTLPDSGGTKVTCLATGFYPRHINLTLFRDGQPVSDHQITGGELLPNGDGTYQMRKSLEVSTEELREKHSYTCTATHFSLDNKLDVKLDFEPGTGAVPVVIPLVVLGVLLLCMVGVIFMRCRRYSFQPSDYGPAQKTNQLLHELDQSAN